MRSKIYLAGGFPTDGRADWRQKIYDSVGYAMGLVDWFDPYYNYCTDVAILKENKNYWGWDTLKIKQSDIVFAYFEKENPGIGSFIELGLAYGLGKHIIVVVEKGNGDEVILDKYRDDCNWFSDASFEKLEDGIEYLKTLL